MPKRTTGLDLDVDLEGGVVPISRAASALAALLKRARERRKPIIVTQKGYPSGVLLDIEVYVALRTLAARASGADAEEEEERARDEIEAAAAVADEEAPASEPAAPSRRPSARRNRAEAEE